MRLGLQTGGHGDVDMRSPQFIGSKVSRPERSEGGNAPRGCARTSTCQSTAMALRGTRLLSSPGRF